ncbi:hypothetical protein [Acetivibrio cellulolyticus]|uniref:hypothetical protein n=1 Tax=Acetivibrio cellulolyticus TaxID=35830 RepID=UPI0001E2C730|nr:hypothetical protein [Acetivibrio cellulolyticus]
MKINSKLIFLIIIVIVILCLVFIRTCIFENGADNQFSTVNEVNANNQEKLNKEINTLAISGEKIKYKYLFNAFIHYDTSETERYKLKFENYYFMRDNEEYENFINEYFVPEKITLEDSNRDKPKLFLRDMNNTPKFAVYEVSSLTIEGNVLNVKLKRINKQVPVYPQTKFGVDRWGMLVELDLNKELLKRNMEIKVERIGED